MARAVHLEEEQVLVVFQPADLSPFLQRLTNENVLRLVVVHDREVVRHRDAAHRARLLTPLLDPALPRLQPPVLVAPVQVVAPLLIVLPHDVRSHLVSGGRVELRLGSLHGVVRARSSQRR